MRFPPQVVKIGIPHQVRDVAVSQADGLFQGDKGILGVREQREAARQIVVGRWVLGPQPNEPLVDL